MKKYALALILPLALGYGTMACSTPEPLPTKHTTKTSSKADGLVSFDASDETSADLGIVKWRVRIQDGVAVMEGLNSSKKVMGHVALRQATGSQTKQVITTIWWANANDSNKGILKVRADKTILNSKMPALMTVWGDHANKDLEAFKSKSKEEYGCIGDILWTIGGGLAAIGTCASVPLTNLPGAAACAGTIIGGPVAGAVSAWEDCGGSSSSSSSAPGTASNDTTGNDTTASNASTGGDQGAGDQGGQGTGTDQASNAGDNPNPGAGGDNPGDGMGDVGNAGGNEPPMEDESGGTAGAGDNDPIDV